MASPAGPADAELVNDRDNTLVSIQQISQQLHVPRTQLLWYIITGRLHPTRGFPLRVTYREWLRFLDHQRGD